MATTRASRRPKNQISIRLRPPTFEPILLHIPRNAFTHAGFRQWVLSEECPEKMRVTFLSGEIYLELCLEELQTHGAVKAEVGRVLLNLNRETKQGKFYLDGVLVTNEEADIATNPDGTFISLRSLRAKRVRLVPREDGLGEHLEFEGTPDWLMEIVSESSVRKDTFELREAYHRAGVPEYWLIDARGEEVVFQILLRRKSGYVRAPDKNGWQKSRIFGREFRLDRQRDELGLWEYTLHVR